METVENAIRQLEALHAASVERLRNDVIAFGRDGTLPPPERRHDGSYAYPELVLTFAGGAQPDDRSRAFGRLNAPGVYATTVTRPALFADYLREQLYLICSDYEVEIAVRVSRQEIPFPYVLDGEAGAELAGISPNEIARHFPATELADIGDELADGIELDDPGDSIPLSLFDGLRTDFSLARLAHYTGTRPEDFQRFILFTNYHRYVDEFVDWAGSQLGKNGCTALAGAGGLYLTEPLDNAREQLSDTAWRRHQMPAYHLVGEGRGGITLVNIGVGPSNAKTATDHIAVLRPHAWLMLGHCAGLRTTQRLGDYVLAHGYVRQDHVLDDDLPLWVPVPPLAEIQVALEQAVADVSGLSGWELKRIMRTGTVASTDNRNWELRDHREPVQQLSQSRAIALDMESATIAANGFRFRVPYGTLLCVSDKPLHGELKLPGMASDFYRTQVARHLHIGLRALELLREMPPERLHSRKLRSFVETAFK
ncbi:MAG: AMP nucleosidase [Erythrobacter sp. 34-65-8]|nr:MAG: AMP nucleosidase [Erythrobacter sp. 34-65-8]